MQFCIEITSAQKIRALENKKCFSIDSPNISIHSCLRGGRRYFKYQSKAPKNMHGLFLTFLE